MREITVRGSRINRNMERSFDLLQKKMERAVNRLSSRLDREDRESLETSEISFDFGIERGEEDGASRETNCLFELVQWKSVYIGFYRILSAGL